MDMTDMNDTTDAPDYGESPITAFVIILALHRELDSAHEYIRKLRQELEAITARRVAEVHFGYQEPRTPSYRWASGQETLTAPTLRKYEKTNTEVATMAMTVGDELLALSADPAYVVDQTKEKLMLGLFIELQKHAKFHEYKERGTFQTTYVIAIEVAK